MNVYDGADDAVVRKCRECLLVVKRENGLSLLRKGELSKAVEKNSGASGAWAIAANLKQSFRPINCSWGIGVEMIGLEPRSQDMKLNPLSCSRTLLCSD